MKTKCKKALSLGAALLSLALAACSYGGDEGTEHINVNDPLSGEDILTTAELISFIEEGTASTANIASSIDIGDGMLDITAQRGPITIRGNGYTLSGNGDCVIRLADGASLSLDGVGITGGAIGIGCLGDATIGGSGAINAVSHAIDAIGGLTVAEGSDLSFSSNVGNGINADTLTVEKGASVNAVGGLGAVEVLGSEMSLGEGASLSAETADNYYALKCEGTVSLKDGSSLTVLNRGEYHGAEISELSIEGVVTIEATGGAKGVGLFLFKLNENYSCLGFCEPEARFEVGKGSLAFYESADDIPEETPEATEEAAEAEPTDGGS